ncbi:hypothetical protein TNIN_227471 [Trichonephila inaurata madagascariensis]|uniref:Uncharacterized protein n=1 Tax=Trichonephila inaurata madagascariensis TaxID=2747483 RepID=A0A8X6YBX7_9ARAC|nr:hypothetical protein TNIN_4361 [Trichonephila inaurata madagascariensis]GFY69443.1 hypothetical protein TNIN_227471 [Trichonephila inaurata madagascariensis]
MEAEKQKSQASTSAPAPPANNSPKPQPNASQPTTAKPQTQPRPTPQLSPPKTSQNTSLLGTLKELQEPQVVELLTTMREIVRISQTDPTQGEKAIELCELLGINF